MTWLLRIGAELDVIACLVGSWRRS